MSLKYRIVYDGHQKYESKSNNINSKKYFFSFLLCILFLLLLACSPGRSKFYELILPGDPQVTADAFHQFSNAIGRGDTIPQALDVFCESIMHVK